MLGKAGTTDMCKNLAYSFKKLRDFLKTPKILKTLKNNPKLKKNQCFASRPTSFLIICSYKKKRKSPFQVERRAVPTTESPASLAQEARLPATCTWWTCCWQLLLWLLSPQDARKPCFPPHPSNSVSNKPQAALKEKKV